MNSPQSYDNASFNEERHDKCGVFGIFSPVSQPIGTSLYYGLYALQHRGQESCGMATFNHDQLQIHKDLGLVNQVFSDSILSRFTGEIGIAHTRYATTGKCTLENAQPVVGRSPLGSIVLAHNGNLIDYDTLRASMESVGFYGFGDSDSHLMVQAIVHYLHHRVTGEKLTLIDAVQRALSQCKGAFAIVMASGDTLIGARDPFGLRPLCIGTLPDGGWVLASETCALDIVGASYVRDLLPGEIWMMSKQQQEPVSSFIDGPKQNSLCIFETVYFSRPDSLINGHSVYLSRLAMGRKLAEKSPNIQADYVIPVPDSGNVAAVGYCQASGIPYAEGLIKNRYVGRTFIKPTQALREQGIKLKLNPLNDVLKGKSLIVVDDSIVRGTTSRKLVAMLRDSGAREVHLRISSAPVISPCFYGIDMSTEEELLANQFNDIESMREWLNADSLVFLTPQDMMDIVKNPHACMACFNREYPAGRPQQSTHIP